MNLECMTAESPGKENQTMYIWIDIAKSLLNFVYNFIILHFFPSKYFIYLLKRTISRTHSLTRYPKIGAGVISFITWVQNFLTFNMLLGMHTFYS